MVLPALTPDTGAAAAGQIRVKSIGSQLRDPGSAPHCTMSPLSAEIRVTILEIGDTVKLGIVAAVNTRDI